MKSNTLASRSLKGSLASFPCFYWVGYMARRCKFNTFCHLLPMKKKKKYVQLPQPNGRLGHAMQRVSKTRSTQKPHRDPNLDPAHAFQQARVIRSGCSSPWHPLIIAAIQSLAPHLVMWLHVWHILMAKYFLARTNEKDICWTMCCVTPKTVVPGGEQSVAKLSFQTCLGLNTPERFG